jgi:biopolymer transport protein ExbB
MLDIKPHHSLAALVGVMALTMGVPAFAQTAAPVPAVAASDAAVSDAAASGLSNGGAVAAPTEIKNAGKLTPIQMFLDAEPVVKVVMVGLLLCSVFSWTLLVTKIFEFGSLNRASDRFLEAFRSARSIADIARISGSEEFEGNPMADMASAAASEVEVSRQAGLGVTGAHRDSTVVRASSAVSAVQAGLSKRLSAGMQFLASVGSSGPFIGLFGTVYGIMNSFIGIANTNTTNLAVVAPGIAEALLATGIGLFAAIPSVIFYNFFQTRISAYGTRTEGFVAELMNAISRQLDKGA